MGASKVLILGATGYLGRHLPLASVEQGHPTFILVRSLSSSDPVKAALLQSFQDAGITALLGSLEDHESLLAAVKQVDVVISAVGGDQLLDQLKLLDAIKEAKNIKRFLPSEFGLDVDNVNVSQDFEVLGSYFAIKRKVRRAIEEAGVPYTYVACGSFAGHYLAPIVQDDIFEPPREKITIFGDGNGKAVFVNEADIGIFTIKSIDDARSENKTLYLRLKENTLSQNEVVALWEQKIGHTLEKIPYPAHEIEKDIEALPYPSNFFLGIKLSVFVLGEQTNFEIGENGVEASALYPDVKYITADEYLNKFL